jgi:vacuolar-type H+-ATPase subunit H
MKEMIEAILEAEQAAERLIAEAKKEAGRIQSENDAHISRIKEELKQQRRKALSEAAAEAREQAASMKADPVPEDLEILLKDYGISPELFERTAEDIKRLIISTEQM